MTETPPRYILTNNTRIHTGNIRVTYGYLLVCYPYVPVCCFGQNYATIYRLANGYLLFLEGASFSCSQRPSDLFSPSSPPPPCALTADQWNPPRFLFSYASSTIAKEKAEGLSTGYKLKSLISSEFHLHIMNFLNVFHAE